MSLRERFEAYIAQHDLARPGDTVVVGVSGGPDSLCLLDLLHALAGGWRLSLHVAHLDHGLRPEAGREAEAVRALAQARGLAFHFASVDTRAHARRRSIEEAARDLRYDFLARVAAEAGAARVAVGHTADDQAETVLMHFLRGSGLAGLRGMLPRVEMASLSGELRRAAGAGSPVWLIRPLLAVARAEVEAYCAGRGLRPAQDLSNQDTAYFRNWLRHEALPRLESRQPRLRAVLCRTAEVMAGEYEIAQQAVQVLWSQAARAEAGRVRFDRRRWLKLSAAEQRALLRRAVFHLRPGLRDAGFAPLEAAVRFSREAHPGRACDLLAGLELRVSADALALCPKGEPDILRPGWPQVDGQGRLGPGWEFRVEQLPGQAGQPPPADAWSTYVDAARIRHPLRLRARRSGDRFQPLGMGGHSMKVSDFMVNARLERAARAGWPIVVSGEDIVWLAGLRLDERFKAGAGSASVLKLEMARTGEE